MSLDPTDPRPPYRQIADDLRRWIDADEVKVGDKLPSISELMAKYGRALSTIRAALNLLHQEGLVMSRQGEGTFVIKKPAAHDGDLETAPRELLAEFRRLSSSLDDLHSRMAVVEQKLFGQEEKDDPRHGSAAG